MTSILGAVVSTLLARALPTSAFGSYALAAAILPFVAMFFEFGIFLPAGRMAARSDEGGRRQVLGGALLAYVPVGLAFSLVVFALSFAVEGWFDAEAGRALRVVAPLALVYPFQFVADQMAQGLGRLHAFAATATLVRLLFVATIVATLAWNAQVTVPRVLLLQASTGLVGWALLVRWLRPVWRGGGERIREFLREARVYGLQVYVGRVLSIGTYNMDVVMVAGFTNSASVGFYTLAGAITLPILLPAMGLAAATFPRMTTGARIDRRVLLLAVGLSAAATGAVLLLARPFIRVVLTPRYLPAASLVPPLALAQLVRGPTALFNSFLSAHGRGRPLRRAGVVLTGCNLVLNLLLIPPFGALGAAWASVLALVANLAAHVASYRGTIREEAAATAAGCVPERSAGPDGGGARRVAREQWTRTPAGTGRAGAEEGSAEFFAQMTATRYRLQPWHPDLLRRFAPRGALLEIGSGAGTDHSRLAAMANRTVAIDLSARGARLTAARLALEGRSGAALVADGERLPFADGTFDAAYSFGVIHHTDHPDAVADEMYRVLRPGGRFLVAVYHRTSMFAAQKVLQYVLSGSFLRERWSRYLGLVEAGAAELDERPLVRLYNRRGACRLFGRFEGLQTEVVHAGVRPRLLQHPLLAERWGWYVVVTGRKPAACPNAVKAACPNAEPAA